MGSATEPFVVVVVFDVRFVVLFATGVVKILESKLSAIPLFEDVWNGEGLENRGLGNMPDAGDCAGDVLRVSNEESGALRAALLVCNGAGFLSFCFFSCMGSTRSNVLSKRKII